MQGLDSFNKDEFHDWIDNETAHLDVVASWENLCETYDQLRFTDNLTDATRLDEYKWIIKEMNKFLTRMRAQLMKSKDWESATAMLMENWKPTGQTNLNDRKALAFQKLRQIWISRMASITRTRMLEEIELLETTESEDYDGWTD